MDPGRLDVSAPEGEAVAVAQAVRCKSRGLYPRGRPQFERYRRPRVQAKGKAMDNLVEATLAGMAIHELILEAHQDNQRDRRSATRYPFFRRVSIRSEGSPIVAFSREISTIGIGLLHDTLLTPGEVEVAIPSKRGYSIRVRTRIVWCQPCGEGWYISGGQFAGVASAVV